MHPAVELSAVTLTLDDITTFVPDQFRLHLALAVIESPREHNGDYRARDPMELHLRERAVLAELAEVGPFSRWQRHTLHIDVRHAVVTPATVQNWTFAPTASAVIDFLPIWKQSAYDFPSPS